MKIKILIAMIAAMSLSACGKDPQPVQQIQPQAQYQQPQQAQQQAPAPAQNSGMQDMLIGGLIGHAIGSSGSRAAAAAPATTTVNRTVINKTYVQSAPAPTVSRQTYSAPSRSSYSAPSRSLSSGRR